MIISTLKDGTILRVRLTPNSSCCKILGLTDNYLRVSVCAVPEDGKANLELIKFLSKKLNISKSCFEIIKGTTCRDKQVLIKDIEPQTILGLINDN